MGQGFNGDNDLCRAVIFVPYSRSSGQAVKGEREGDLTECGFGFQKWLDGWAG